MSSSSAAAPDFERVERILQQACGLVLSKGLRKALESSYSKAADAMRISESELLTRLSAGDPESISSLIDHSVIGETYFFRHPEHFKALRNAFAKDFAGEPELRVWSAGCASGEEPYSLAMALLEAGRTLTADRILATDVSRRALQLARAATYGDWSLRKLDPALRKRFFEAAPGDQVRVVEAARALVEFKRHNLVNDPAPLDGCHVVFCRNVLIYFTPETIARVLHKLAAALRPGGLLVLGPVEVPQAAMLGMEWLDSDGVTLLRKPDPDRPAPRRAPPARAATPPPPRAPAASRPCAERQARRAAAPPAAPPPPAAPVVASAPPSCFELAREAARRGRLDEAEKLARDSAKNELLPEAFLLLSMTAESRGDLPAAVEALRRALYLEPKLAAGHAALVPLYERLGKPQEAERARRNALHALEGLEEAAPLVGVEAMTAGALRRALQQENAP